MVMAKAVAVTMIMSMIVSVSMPVVRIVVMICRGWVIMAGMIVGAVILSHWFTPLCGRSRDCTGLRTA